MKNSIKFNSDSGLVSAIIQNASTNKVLMLGYMNKESLQKTINTKKVWFYSRSKKRLWMKGEKSKNYLYVTDIKIDCDKDVLLIKVNPAGPTCHLGKVSCFDDKHSQTDSKNNLDVILNLYELILARKKKMPKGSYTAKLFNEGTGRICAKVVEEAGEVVVAALSETKKRFVEESADLVYHWLVLLAEKGIGLVDILFELEKRKGGR